METGSKYSFLCVVPQFMNESRVAAIKLNLYIVYFNH